MNPRKLWLVMSYEMVYNLRRRSFLFVAFVMPIMIGGFIYISARLTADSEINLDDYQRVGVVDQADLLADVNDPADAFWRYEFFADEATARAAFDNDDIAGYFVVPAEYLSAGQIDYYSSKSLPDALRGEFRRYLVTGVSVGVDSPYLSRLQYPMNIEHIRVLGEEDVLDEEALIARFVLPIVFVMLFAITVMVTSQFLMTGVAEEKENRISEILLTSVRTSELMVGKAAGLGTLALIQVAYMLGLGFIVGNATNRMDLVADMHFKTTDVALMFTYFVLSFGLFAAIMLAVGAASAAEQESRQMAALFIIPAMIPVYATPLFIEKPESIIAVAFSLFPFTAPVSSLMLLAVGSLRTWQAIASLAILVTSIFLAMWISSKVFRRGVLMYDERLNFKQLWALLRRS